MARFEGKVVVVTGAAKGIGEATAFRFSREGATMVLLDLHEEELRPLQHAMHDADGECDVYACDVADAGRVTEVFADIGRRRGHVDVLVNNAGIGGPSGPLEDVSLAEWHRLLAVNLDGVFLCTRSALPLMRRGGSVVNMSSIYGLVGSADVAAYHASKGAVRLFTKAVALQVAPRGIRVNSVHPGFIDTPMVRGYVEASGHAPEMLARLAALHPLGHLGRSEDVAGVVAFLASDDAAFVTGAELVVDGGYTAQ